MRSSAARDRALGARCAGRDRGQASGSPTPAAPAVRAGGRSSRRRIGGLHVLGGELEGDQRLQHAQPDLDPVQLVVVHRALYSSTRTSRKPIASERTDWVARPRAEARSSAGGSHHAPPRTTRIDAWPSSAGPPSLGVASYELAPQVQRPFAHQAVHVVEPEAVGRVGAGRPPDRSARRRRGGSGLCWRRSHRPRRSGCANRRGRRTPTRPPRAGGRAVPEAVRPLGERRRVVERDVGQRRVGVRRGGDRRLRLTPAEPAAPRRLWAAPAPALRP